MVYVAPGRIGQLLAELPPEAGRAVVLGPVPAPFELLRGRYRHHFLVKAPRDSGAFARAREVCLERARSSGNTRMLVDVDPMAML